MHVLPPRIRWRKLIALASCSVFTLLLVILYSPNSDVRARLHSIKEGRGSGTHLPTYDRIFELERNLPQHNVSLRYPEGKSGRYVKFSNQIQGLGWNNVLTEVLLCSHLAWRAKRAYVFQDYHWNIQHYPLPIPKNTQPRTPFNALVAGPTAGGSWAEGDDTPRSVSADWFNVVCPPEDTEIINTDVAKEPIRGADGKYVLEHWLRLFNESPKRCVNVVGEPSDKDNYPQTFDLWVVSTTQILTMWSDFRDSPVSKLLRTSPLVNSAVERNEHLLFSPSAVAYTDPYAGVMAVHLRRGDYLGACQHFSTWNSSYYGWNLLPHLPDRFTPPRSGASTSERDALYFKRCFPNETQILSKIKDSKLEWETHPASQGHKLSSLYIMTNADREWLNGLKARLLAAGWSTAVSSGDLMLDAEQTSVAMSVDMDIGRRAAVFIGNGWSSMTSSVVHRRLVDENDPVSTRFW